jgi:hypothetical protein
MDKTDMRGVIGHMNLPDGRELKRKKRDEGHLLRPGGPLLACRPQVGKRWPMTSTTFAVTDTPCFRVNH